VGVMGERVEQSACEVLGAEHLVHSGTGRDSKCCVRPGGNPKPGVVPGSLPGWFLSGSG
jgi:hypothetical protein